MRSMPFTLFCALVVLLFVAGAGVLILQAMAVTLVLDSGLAPFSILTGLLLYPVASAFGGVTMAGSSMLLSDHKPTMDEFWNACLYAAAFGMIISGFLCLVGGMIGMHDPNGIVRTMVLQGHPKAAMIAGAAMLLLGGLGVERFVRLNG